MYFKLPLSWCSLAYRFVVRQTKTLHKSRMCSTPLRLFICIVSFLMNGSIFLFNYTIAFNKINYRNVKVAQNRIFMYYSVILLVVFITKTVFRFLFNDVKDTSPTFFAHLPRYFSTTGEQTKKPPYSPWEYGSLFQLITQLPG